jgi:hypothetical protein
LPAVVDLVRLGDQQRCIAATCAQTTRLSRWSSAVIGIGE